MLIPAVDWILHHQGDLDLPIPLEHQDQMRIVAAGGGAAAESVASFFRDVATNKLHRAVHSLGVLNVVASMVHPTVEVVDALCGILPLFSGSPTDLAGDEHWASYLLATSAALGRVSTYVHFTDNEWLGPAARGGTSLRAATAVLGR